MGYTAQQKEQFKKVFNEIDSNGNGVLEVKELIPFLESASSQRVNETDVVTFLHNNDMNGDDKIDFDEFLKLLASLGV